MLFIKGKVIKELKYFFGQSLQYIKQQTIAIP